MFSFGSNKSRSSSSSEQLGLGYGYSGSLSDSLSESYSQGTSQSQGTSYSTGLTGSSGTSASRQSIAYDELFRQLFGSATGATQRAAELVPALQGQAAQLFSSGTDFLGQLQGGAGQDYLTSRVTGDNAILDEQIDLLGQDIGRFLREEVNPTLTSNALSAGQLGGGRQGVAQGLAARAATNEFQKGAAALRSADQSARDALAGQLMQGQTQAAGVGLSALPGLMGLAESGLGAELAPYAMLSQIMGGPTVLTEAVSEQSAFGQQLSESQQTAFSQQTAESIAEAISRAFGEDFSYNYGTSKSTSKSGGFSFGFGG